MKILKKLWLKYQIKKYEDILIREGIREMYRCRRTIPRDLENQISSKEYFMDEEYSTKGRGIKEDFDRLIFLGSIYLKDEEKRYRVYSKMLERLEKRKVKDRFNLLEKKYL